MKNQTIETQENKLIIHDTHGEYFEELFNSKHEHEHNLILGVAGIGMKVVELRKAHEAIDNFEEAHFKLTEAQKIAALEFLTEGSFSLENTREEAGLGHSHILFIFNSILEAEGKDIDSITLTAPTNIAQASLNHEGKLIIHDPCPNGIVFNDER